MPLIVHGDPRSTCTQRVLVALVEKGVEYEVRTIDWAAKEHKQAAFLAKQPFGKVPVLEDDGFFVYESRAMAKYIAKKYAGQGTKLIPDEADVKGYGLFEQVGVQVSARGEVGCSQVARRAPSSRTTSTGQLRALLWRRCSRSEIIAGT